MKDLRTLLAELIAFESVTPRDAGCNAFMISQLEALGFHCETINVLPVHNFFARIGKSSPLLVFAGHTDVVPTGDREKWNSDPFCLHQQDDRLFGRGVTDMKGSLACMIHMASRFVHDFPRYKGSLGFLITSGEEGDDAELGTPVVMKHLEEIGVSIDYCIVGEPSSNRQVGDVIKIGRRGSMTATLTLSGKQGHVAYPHLADNPIHRVAPALTELTQTHWDSGNQWFPPTSMQITKLQCGGHANNIIPGELFMNFNFRFSTEQTPESLQHRVEQCFTKHQLTPEIHWKINGLPFLTQQGLLLQATREAIQKVSGLAPELSTSGGTSDGRFIAPYGVEVIELGPVNESIHQINEWVSFKDLVKLEDMYYRIAQYLLT